MLFQYNLKLNKLKQQLSRSDTNDASSLSDITELTIDEPATDQDPITLMSRTFPFRRPKPADASESRFMEQVIAHSNNIDRLIAAEPKERAKSIMSEMFWEQGVTTASSINEENTEGNSSDQALENINQDTQIEAPETLDNDEVGESVIVQMNIP